MDGRSAINTNSNEKNIDFHPLNVQHEVRVKVKLF